MVGLAALYVDKALGFSLGWAAWVSCSLESGFQSGSIHTVQLECDLTYGSSLLHYCERSELTSIPCSAAEVTAAAVVIGYWKDIPHVHTV